MSLWGKAGQRLSAKEIQERRHNRQAIHAVATQEEHRRIRIAHQRWAAGLVRPDLITMWLDYRGLTGPHVDAACSVPEPTVDLWEAGRVYPTWEQLQALARLCQVGVWRFTEEERLTVHLCSRGRGLHEPTQPPITSFHPLALATAGIQPFPTTPTTEQNGQTRLI